jgi:hypothetical protein
MQIRDMCSVLISRLFFSTSAYHTTVWLPRLFQYKGDYMYVRVSAKVLRQNSLQTPASYEKHALAGLVHLSLQNNS